MKDIIEKEKWYPMGKCSFEYHCAYILNSFLDSLIEMKNDEERHSTLSVFKHSIDTLLKHSKI